MIVDNNDEFDFGDLGREEPVEPVPRPRRKAAAPKPPPPPPPEELGLEWITRPTEHEGRLWIPGRGPTQTDIMVLGHHARHSDQVFGAAFKAGEWENCRRIPTECGFRVEDAYWTYLVKFVPDKKKPGASEYRMCTRMLHEEIRRTGVKLIICLGAEPFKRMTGCKLMDQRMERIPHPLFPDVEVIGTYDPDAIKYDARLEEAVRQDWRRFANEQRGRTLAIDRPPVHVFTNGLALAHWLDNFVDSNPSYYAAIDAEWNGRHWMDPDGYLRTFQFALSNQHTYVVEFYAEDKLPVIAANPEHEARAWASIRRFLTAPGCFLIGHNLIADGEWLMEKQNIDLRPRTYWDTMLAEHVRDSAGTFNLTHLIEKYTCIGKYDAELLAWTTANAERCVHGYGSVPRTLLNPYGGYDALGTFQVAMCQIPLLEAAGYLRPRGEHGEYPSLMQASLDCQAALYEIQREGIGVDRQRLAELTEAYNDKLETIRHKLVVLASNHDMPSFNPASVEQCQDLLFRRLNLTPICSTDAHGSIPWAKVMAEPPEVQARIAPSTDKTTLDILQDEHEIVRTLRDFRKIEYAVRTWLVADDEYDPASHDEVSKGGGLRSKIWPDGRIHSRFSQLKETARLSSRLPNVQNFPKRAEGDIERVFGKAKKPPDLRTIFVPKPGWFIVEADWTQAELFTLAALSGDKNMWEALNTPGKDLHDLTAVSSFGLKLIGPEGHEISDTYLVQLAAEKGTKAYKAYVEQVTYVDQRGKRMTRADFKNTVRVSAKNL